MMTENLTSKLEYFFHSEYKKRDEVKNFLEALCKIGSPIIFGGMLRDISIGGNRNFYSDIDIVMANVTEEKFSSFLDSFEPKTNFFGGKRINLGQWPVDIWRIEDTWAFKNEVVPFKNEESLLKTTFFNWDAILYNYQEKKLFHVENYFENLDARILEINCQPNPNNFGILKRTVKFLNNNNARVARSLCSFFIQTSESLIQLQTSPDAYSLEICRIGNHMKRFLLDPHAQYFKLQVDFGDSSTP